MQRTIDSFSGEFAFLSNFHPWPVSIRLTPDGEHTVECATVEHAFQACKSLDPVEREDVALAPTPGKAKRLGRTVQLRPGWNDMRLDVMRALLAQKFSPSSSLAAALLATGDAHLVEGNHWHDRFWGVCDGRGQNHLGRLLMERRAELRP